MSALELKLNLEMALVPRQVSVLGWGRVLEEEWARPERAELRGLVCYLN